VRASRSENRSAERKQSDGKPRQGVAPSAGAPSGATEREYVRWDPKGGDLCALGAKPGETPVEVPAGTDVQIVRLKRG
jgi:hypothetical protein